MAYEDFTTYTEFDESADVTVESATKVSWVSLLTRQQTSYLYKDKGVNHFSGDFNHKLEMLFGAMGNVGQAVSWMLANVVGDLQDIIGASEDAIVFSVYDDTENLVIQIYENGIQVAIDSWPSSGPQIDTNYYIEIVRDADGGVNGTGRYTIYIRTESHTGTLRDTLIVDSPVGGQKDFRYIYALATKDDNNGNPGSADGFTQNLDIGDLTNYTFEAEAGTYALTGTNAEVLRDSVFGASAGSYALTGSDLNFYIGKRFVAGSGDYTLSGSEASILHDKILSPASGSYSLTGTNAEILRDIVFGASAGSYALTGTDVDLAYMPVSTDYEVGWKADKDLGAWDFTEQTDKFGYLNNKNWSKLPAAVAFSESLNLQVDREDKHLPCGHWHKKEYYSNTIISRQTVNTGRWVAAMPKPETVYVYLYDVTYKAVIKIEVANPVLLKEILPLTPLYSLDHSVGGTQKGGYCMDKDGTTLWYLFRDSDTGSCQLIEVDISGATMSITKKTTFADLMPGESIKDGCSNNTYTYWPTSLLDGRIIKIQNSDHSIIDDHLFSYPYLCSTSDSESIATIDTYDDSLYWTYVRGAYCAAGGWYNARAYYVKSDTDLNATLVVTQNGSGLATPSWQNMIRIYSEYILHHRNYWPGCGTLTKKSLSWSVQSNLCQYYLRNILGTKDANIFALQDDNSIAGNAHLNCINFSNMTLVKGLDVNYYTGRGYLLSYDWDTTAVSALSETAGSVIMVRYHNDEARNYVACFSADASLNLICDTPLSQIITTTTVTIGNTEILSAEPVVWSMD